jgi:nucleoside 2-deoxyribosyltransferase
MTTIKAFYASPYAPEYGWIRDAVAAACRQHNIALRVVDEVAPPGENINELMNQEIADADLAIALLTGLNPNVMYELGRLLAESKPTILLADEDTFKSMPFDLRSFASIQYDSMLKNKEELTLIVSSAIGRIISLRSFENRKKLLAGTLPWQPIPSVPSASLVSSSEEIDFEGKRKDAERRLGKKLCKTVEIEAQSDDDGSTAGYIQTLKCQDGDKVIIIIDQNGEIKRIKVD